MYLDPSTTELCPWKRFMFQLIVYFVDYVLVYFDSLLTYLCLNLVSLELWMKEQSWHLSL